MNHGAPFGRSLELAVRAACPSVSRAECDDLARHAAYGLLDAIATAIEIERRKPVFAGRTSHMVAESILRELDSLAVAGIDRK